MAERAHMPDYTFEELRSFERRFDQIYPNGVLAKFSLEDRVAIVTGAGQGNGRAIALCFAGAGADIVVVDIRKDTCEATAKEIRAIGRKALPIVTDVTKEDQVQDMVDKTLAEFGKINVLMNNVGGGGGGRGGGRATPLDATWEAWDRGLTTTLKSTLLCSQAVAKAMIHGKIRGTIVNMSAGFALHPGPGGGAPSKAGVEHFTKSLALYLAQYYIRVNAIAPGCIHTPWTRVGLGSDEIRVKERGMPLARIGQPEDVALAALYLASDASDWVTGHTIEVNGGEPYARMGVIAEDESRRARAEAMVAARGQGR